MKIGIKTELFTENIIGVSLWDTRIGISPEQQDLGFEQFHQDRGHIYPQKEERTCLGLLFQSTLSVKLVVI